MIAATLLALGLALHPPGEDDSLDPMEVKALALTIMAMQDEERAQALGASWDIGTATASVRRFDLDGDGHEEVVSVAFVSADDSAEAGAVRLSLWTTGGAMADPGCRRGEDVRPQPEGMIPCSDGDLLLSVTLDEIPDPRLAAPDGEPVGVEARLDRIIATEAVTGGALPPWSQGALRPSLPEAVVIQSVVPRDLWEAVRAADVPIWCYLNQDEVCLAFAPGYEDPIPLVTFRRLWHDPPSFLPLIADGTEGR